MGKALNFGAVGEGKGREPSVRAMKAGVERGREKMQPPRELPREG